MTWLKQAAGCAALAGGMPLLVLASLYAAAALDSAELTLPSSRLYVDRLGRPLRFVPDERGERHLPTIPGEIPPVVRRAFMAAEDERFLDHRGVDWAAVGRAARDNLAAGRVVSGASTITQQLCRLARPRRRTLAAKVLEAVAALRLERSMGKEEILHAYLDRVPLGNNLLGVRAAAVTYFGKKPGELDVTEAALLAALPKAPGALNPYGPGGARLSERRDWVLGRMRDLGYLTEEEWETAVRRAVSLAPRSFPFEAPHLVDYLESAVGQGRSGVIGTTIDLKLQRRVEAILRSHEPRLAARGASQAAVVVMENDSRGVLAMAGSLAYGQRDGGYVNGAMALRSPGSALKPFLYARALDGGWTAAGLLEDVSRVYRFPGGEYEPENFDRQTNGPVSLRTALANSLNLSAVDLLNQVGYATFHRTLLDLGLINFPEHDPGYYGLGLVVGNPEVSLLQLAAAYAALAGGGEWRPPRLLGDADGVTSRRIFSAQASAIVADILSDPAARQLAFAGSLAMAAIPGAAFKTGTSTRYRDCWAVGFTPRHTVAVWAGNFPGQPTWSMSGAALSAPVVADVLAALLPGGTPPFTLPPGVARTRVCSLSGLLPGVNCGQVTEELFIAGTEPLAPCNFHERGPFTDLSAGYAGWIGDRAAEKAAGRWRLAAFDREGEGSPGYPAKPVAPVGVARGESAVRIARPLDGERILREPGEVQGVVTCEAVAGNVLPEVTWYVDGVEVASTAPPYRVELSLGRGRHELSATSGDGEGSVVVVVIE